MVLVRFGKERESTTWSSEEYKNSIRRYMEAGGFSQSHNSFTDGTQVDMIFEPFLDSGRRAWVEAKNAEVGITDPDLQRELLGYLTQWLQMPPQDRFEFRIFVRKMSGAKSWEKLFSGKSSSDEIMDWVKKASQKGSYPVISEALESRQTDVVHFFSTSYAYEGDKLLLDRVIEEKEESSALGIRRLAEREDHEMIKRCHLGTKRATFVSNLVPVTIPSTFCVITVEEGSIEEIRERLKGIHLPPYYVLSKCEILTLDLPEYIELFSPAKIRDSRQVTKEASELEYENELTKLLNTCISRIISGKGGLKKEDDGRHIFFFPVRRGRRGLEPFTIQSSSGKEVTISSPKMEKPDAIMGEGLSISVEDGELNHCFHKGLEARLVRYWGRCFVSMKLKRIYTSDGHEPLEGDHASRLDAKYRNANYNRGETQLSVLNAYAYYLFSQKMRDKFSPIWIDQFKFDRLLTIDSEYSPVLIDVGQCTLELLGEEDDIPED